jgi:hypothetical protein
MSEIAYPEIDILGLPSRTRIARGNDSDVFRSGDSVYKVYHTIQDPDVIRRYKDLTQYAIAAVDTEFSYGTLVTNGTTYKYSVTINPVDKVCITPRDQPVAVSRYIPGTCLQDMIWFRQRRATYDLKEYEENGPHQDTASIVYQGEFSPSLRELSQMISHHTNIEGVDIIPTNIKPYYYPESESVNLVVTDLASKMEMIKWLYSK